MSEAGITLDDILEAALLAAGEPLAVERLETLFAEAERPARGELRLALSRLGERHAGGALELVESASGHQLRIRPRLSPWVSRLWDERPARYSRALLETLALIAYRQPVTRGDIEEVRGVSVSSSIMRTLSERGWIRIVGHRDVPGRPGVYATTRSFLDDFGLKTLDALPPMHELTGDQKAAEATDDDKPAEPLADEEKTRHDAPPETAASEEDDAANHAATALTRPLSFADLEARLAARAGRADDDERPDENPTRSDDHESE
ncbi:SMC-Scp complex subunit ScpB [Halomonas piscis]|uniref:SMC-Scp complex subunit ScpB n=1 Tax=Halomonas piscis TaxID=3031727 RepID=A0ABY9YXR8_9GAMM|nr:SMC-Scp complex subunit ScpB [Halomonas piscis]WNK19674.1 SMC-Scp complex subunit ScpB [Halomonas piscis]